MTWVDFVRGAGTILIIMIIAGAIAYVGDRVGHQVGRKRLTLFNIRPRYTSTIVAIATGMVIALFVTLGAILASQQVKTAFFRLNAINREIAELQTRERGLETKVTSGHLVVPTDTLMVPFARIIRPNDSPEARLAIVKSFYQDAVRYMNATYASKLFGLKPFKAPPDVEKILKGAVDDPIVFVPLAAGHNVIMMVASDQNLYKNDQIHFALQFTPDDRKFVRGQPIATIEVPGNAGANVNIVVSELQTVVATEAEGLPEYLRQISSIKAVQSFPEPARMQAMLSKPGKYYVTAYAAEDIYPHTGYIPIVVALTAAGAGR